MTQHAGRYLLQQQMEAEREKMKVIVSKSPEKVARFVARSFSLIKSLRGVWKEARFSNTAPARQIV